MNNRHEEIYKLLTLLERVWLTNPNLRFFQLVQNIHDGMDKGDWWFTQDRDTLARLDGLSLAPDKIAGKYRGEI